ncbi:hypothetical protein QF031_000704 [Pseudarthrobacter defluvii]|uniref:hypothetical protein n=1 Tax=Pseudarthrobacter defluvii TaxID=410837 RepID=UPI00278205EF|nr:hypothetical protein [Pseudarthrobacter defluvii]MDQ0767955.1 hypothetical protein [Pseudarthrobacter defluvii]
MATAPAALHVLATVAQPLGERLLLASVGPIIGAVLGTGLIGLIVWKITDRIQSERTAANILLEQTRADRALETQLRMDVLTTAFTMAGRLYLECNMYMRIKGDSSVTLEEKSKARIALDKHYVDCRAGSMVLQARLEAIFAAEDPAIEWHRIDDLLTVRYMRITGQASDRLYEINAKGFGGKLHSGLSKEELQYDGTIIANYHLAMKALTSLMLTTNVVGVHTP